jgi:membrane protein implicated in regulation of membrane protease activity
MQSRLSSFAETLLNTLSGFFVSMVASLFIFPVLGVHMTMQQNFWSVVMFTIVSIIRGYFWRRYFNYRLHKAVNK